MQISEEIISADFKYSSYWFDMSSLISCCSEERDLASTIAGLQYNLFLPLAVAWTVTYSTASSLCLPIFLEKSSATDSEQDFGIIAAYAVCFQIKQMPNFTAFRMSATEALQTIYQSTFTLQFASLKLLC
jgi:hypothetical protein